MSSYESMPPEIADMMERVRLREFEKTPEWDDALPKEATREPNDYPITNTKVAAVLQGRRVQRGAWWVTLQSVDDWRKHFSPRLAEIIGSIEAHEKARDVCKLFLYKNSLGEYGHVLTKEVEESMRVIAGEDSDKIIALLKAEADMIRRGMNLV